MAVLPIDVATKQTLSFIERHVRLSSASILEVGCGRGDLAKALADKGAAIMGLDCSDEAIAATREKGIAAVHCDFTKYDPDEAFDVIAFARSLHHIEPLSLAMERTRALLKPGGMLVLEDFAAETMNEPTLAWMRKEEAELDDSLRMPPGEVNHRFPFASLDMWNDHHFVHHHVSSSTDMLEALQIYFPETKVKVAPYLYRYLIDRLKANNSSGDALQHILDRELQAISRDEILPIGWRVVAR